MHADLIGFEMLETEGHLLNQLIGIIFTFFKPLRCGDVVAIDYEEDGRRDVGIKWGGRLLNHNQW